MRVQAGRELLYISRDDAMAAGLTPEDIAASIEAAFAARARHRAYSQPKLSLPATGETEFTGKAGVLLDAGYASIKWYGYAPGNTDRGLPHFLPLILLNKADSGLPVALIDGLWISAVRTAAITAVAASRLARPDARSAGFVACGAQAYSNLDALRTRLPITNVVAYSRRLETAERFAEAARAKGLAARAVIDPRAAVEGQDVVVTTVPRRGTPREFLDSAWVSPGAFVSMVDLGYGWRRETIVAFDQIVTDEINPVTGRSIEALNYDGGFESDLSGLVVGACARRRHDARIALIFAGTGLADTAAATTLYQRAIERGLGRPLPI